MNNEQAEPPIAPPADVTLPTRLSHTIFQLLLIVTVGYAVLQIVTGTGYVLQQDGLEVDAGLFAEGARIQLNGGLIYRDLYDNKPPGIFFSLMPFVAAFGNTTLAINLATVFINGAFGLSIAVLAYLITRSHWSGLAAGLIALLYSVTSIKPETTILMSAFSVAAISCAVVARGRPLWLLLSGLIYMAGFFTKQPVVLELPVLVLFAALYTPRKQRLSAFVALIAGMLLTTDLLLSWVIANGILGDFWRNVYTAAQRYVFTSSGAWHFSSDAAGVFEHNMLRDTLPRFFPLLLFGLLAAIGLWRANHNRKVLLVTLVWAASSLSAAMMGISMKFLYYMQVVPALALLVALSIPQFRRARLPVQIAFTGLALLAVIRYSDRFIFPVPDNWPGWTPYHSEVVTFIEENSQPDECLWTWGYINSLNYWAARNSCASAPYEGPLMVGSLFSTESNRIQYMQEMIDRDPALLIDERAWGYFPELQKYADRYRGAIVFQTDRYTIYNVDRSSWHALETPANFGGEVALIGYDIFGAPAEVCPGDRLELALTWQQLSRPTHEYQVFVQVLTPDEQAKIAGYDGVPVRRRPTYTWVNTGEVILGEPFELALPEHAEAGTYPLVAGLYEVETAQILPAVDAQPRTTGNYARLQDIRIADDC